MKRSLAILLSISLIFVLGISPVHAAVKPGSSCKKLGSTSTSSGKTFTCIKKNNKLVWNSGVKSKSSDSGVSVDKNLLNVVITIPASFYEGTKVTQQQLDADAAKNGYGKAKLNSDGSVTWSMSKAEHRKVMADFKKSVDDYIQEAVDESPKVFREVTYDEKMTEFKVKVYKEMFEQDLSAGFIGFGIAILAQFYQMFSSGVKDPKVVIQLIDVSTNRMFETEQYPAKN